MFLLYSAQVCRKKNQFIMIASQCGKFQILNCLRCDSEARGHRKANFGHFCTIGTLASKKSLHASIAFSMSLSEIVNAFDVLSSTKMKSGLLKKAQ